MPNDLSPEDLRSVLACSRGSSLEEALAHLVDCPDCLARLSGSGGDTKGPPPARLLPFGRPGSPAELAATAVPRVDRERGSDRLPATRRRRGLRRASVDGWATVTDAATGTGPDTSGETGGEVPGDGSMATWLLRLRDRCVADEDRAPALLDELLSHPPEQRRVLLRNEPRFHTYPLAVLLMEESSRQVLDDPREAEGQARLALAISQRIDVGLRAERLGLDLQARAWATVGNALRVRGELGRAQEAFERSAELLVDSFDPLEKARHLDLLSALRRDQRRVEESLELCQQALDLYLSVGETGGAARVLTRRGSLLANWGETEEALEPLARARELLDASGDAREAEPYTALVIRHNLAYCKVKLGLSDEARQLFRECLPLYHRIPGRLVHLRRRWLEGLIAAADGSLERAEELLDDVQGSFLQLDLDYEAAMVSLDLAQVYARERRLTELEELTRQLVTIFDSRGLQGECLVALAYLQQAAERRAAGVRVVRHVASYLSRSRYKPELPFERPGLEFRLE